ncbi:MAG TPA: hypothetical protein VLT16_03115, partial [Candidatus Limnocylindrales bacterium]|nr:hypothetical protein [Candidatus Limnocylindrales bacterium]
MKSRNLSSCMALAIAFGMCMFGVASAAASQGAPSAIARKTGTVKSISGNTIALKTDSGEDVAITVQENARILRVEPGQTDLKSATPMALADIQPGDRLLARGHQGESAGTLTAAAIIVMKSGD